MSAESLRARLEAATPGPWGFEATQIMAAEGVPSYWPWELFAPEVDQTILEGSELHDTSAIGDLIAHAPTDLEAALKVIEAARHLSIDGTITTTEAAWVALDEALDVFEALP